MGARPEIEINKSQGSTFFRKKEKMPLFPPEFFGGVPERIRGV